MKRTPQVEVLHGKGWPPAGSESCVGVGRPTRRSVDSGRESHVMEPRKTIDGARAVIHANGSTAAPLGPGVEVRPGSESVACAQGSAPEPGRSHRLPVESAGGATGNQKPP